MRNNKKTAILVKEVNTKKRLFLVYRPNTGRQLKLETYADIKKRFKKVIKQTSIRSAVDSTTWSIFFTLNAVRSCQKMPSSTGQTSTNHQHKYVLMHIGTWAFWSLMIFYTFLYFAYMLCLCVMKAYTHTLIYMSQDWFAKCENIWRKYLLSFSCVNDRVLFCFQEREL